MTNNHFTLKYVCVCAVEYCHLCTDEDTEASFEPHRTIYGSSNTNDKNHDITKDLPTDEFGHHSVNMPRLRVAG